MVVDHLLFIAPGDMNCNSCLHRGEFLWFPMIELAVCIQEGLVELLKAASCNSFKSREVSSSCSGLFHWMRLGVLNICKCVSNEAVTTEQLAQQPLFSLARLGSPPRAALGAGPALVFCAT